MSKLEQAVEAVMKDGRSWWSRPDISKALRPFINEAPSVEVDLDLRIDELVGDLEAFLLPGDMGIIRRTVARTFEALAAELQPTGVSDETIEAAALDIENLLDDVADDPDDPCLWPTRREMERALRDRFQPKPKPKVWEGEYPEERQLTSRTVPRIADAVLVFIWHNDGRLPQAVDACRGTNRWYYRSAGHSKTLELPDEWCALPKRRRA